MKKSIIIIWLFAFISFSGFCQIERTYHWYFGDKAGIDFSSGQPVAVTDGQMSVLSGCSSMSDKQGNLLMYTDGKSVWNRNHQIMPNGTGLGIATSTPNQSSVIVPLPGSNHIYYIFHQTTFDYKDVYETHGLKYSIVDMNMDGGLGDVIEKSNLLINPCSESMAAVMHENCEDIWVIGHKRGTNDFYAFLITQNGIAETVINTVGNFANAHLKTANFIRFSPNGRKVAISCMWNPGDYPELFDTLYLFDFDRTTAIISNPITIADTTTMIFGFSPDNTKLYVSNGYFDAWTHQYDISSNDENTIRASKILLYYDEYWTHQYFQNAVDNKVYVSKSGTQYVDVINSPNDDGIACNLIVDAFYLESRYCLLGLPDFIESYFDYGENSCWKTDTVPEEQGSVYIPNIFSPNGDGINDILFVRGSNIDQLYFAVFSRWGEKVFETRDMNCGWDGTYIGKHAETGVYVYFIEATLSTEKTITKSGDVTLIR